MTEDEVRHFKLLQELGRGAAGVIHLALDVQTQTTIDSAANQCASDFPELLAQFGASDCE